jgi:predicted HTH transcriptional regulator
VAGTVIVTLFGADISKIKENILTPETNERQKKALEYLKLKGKLNNKEYQVICSTNRVAAFRDLSDLTAKGLVDKIGKTGRWAYYRLKR